METVTGSLTSGWDKIRTKVDGMVGTDIEKKVKEATSAENWGASGTLKAEIARATFDYERYGQVMPIVWRRLAETPRNWRMIFKTLTLLEHLIQSGADKVVEETRDKMYIIRGLQDFHYTDPEGRDRGNGIREMSKKVCNLLNDSRRLNKVREDARRNRPKFAAMSSGWGGTHLDSFGSHMNPHSTSYDNTRWTDGQYDQDARYDDGHRKSKTSKKKKPKYESENDSDTSTDDSSESFDEPHSKSKAAAKKKKKSSGKTRDKTRRQKVSKPKPKPKKEKSKRTGKSKAGKKRSETHQVPAISGPPGEEQLDVRKPRHSQEQQHVVAPVYEEAPDLLFEADFASVTNTVQSSVVPDPMEEFGSFESAFQDPVAQRQPQRQPQRQRQRQPQRQPQVQAQVQPDQWQQIFAQSTHLPSPQPPPQHQHQQPRVVAQTQSQQAGQVEPDLLNSFASLDFVPQQQPQPISGDLLDDQFDDFQSAEPAVEQSPEERPKKVAANDAWGIGVSSLVDLDKGLSGFHPPPRVETKKPHPKHKGTAMSAMAHSQPPQVAPPQNPPPQVGGLYGAAAYATNYGQGQQQQPPQQQQQYGGYGAYGYNQQQTSWGQQQPYGF